MSMFYFGLSGKRMGKAIINTIQVQRDKHNVNGPRIAVQIGSNTGNVGNDPIWALLEDGSFDKALLIEPLPHVFKRLKRNCENLTSKNLEIALDNTAIGSKSDPEKITLYSAADERASQLASREKLHTTQWLNQYKIFGIPFIPKVIDTSIVKHEVPCNPLSTVLLRHNMQNKQLDILDVDTEGYDLEILDGIDWTDFKPLVVAFEHGHTEGTQKPCGERYNKFLERMNERGYDVAFIDVADTVLVLR